MRADFRLSVRDRGHVRGCFVKLSGLETIDAIAASGADFCVLDLEHATIGEVRAFEQIAYARALGLPCLVRVAAIEPGPIGRFLDAGATGIQLADVSSAEDARALARCCRYAPTGDRGMSPSQRDGGYGLLSVDDLQSGAAGEPFLVGQVERDLEPTELAGIAAAGLDVLFVGHADLSVRLGPRDTPERRALVAAAAGRVADAATAAGVVYGEHAAGPDGHDRAMYTTVTSDAVVLAAGLRAAFGGAR